MTPESHRDQATQLLADVNDAADQPSAQRVLTQTAIAHALLGLLEIEIGKARRVEFTHADAVQVNGNVDCAHCGESVTWSEWFNLWYHSGTNRTECFRDPKHTETATPERI